MQRTPGGAIGPTGPGQGGGRGYAHAQRPGESVSTSTAWGRSAVINHSFPDINKEIFMNSYAPSLAPPGYENAVVKFSGHEYNVFVKIAEDTNSLIFTDPKNLKVVTNISPDLLYEDCWIDVGTVLKINLKNGKSFEISPCGSPAELTGVEKSRAVRGINVVRKWLITCLSSPAKTITPSLNREIRQQSQQSQPSDLQSPQQEIVIKKKQLEPPKVIAQEEGFQFFGDSTIIPSHLVSIKVPNEEPEKGDEEKEEEIKEIKENNVIIVNKKETEEIQDNGIDGYHTKEQSDYSSIMPTPESTESDSYDNQNVMTMNVTVKGRDINKIIDVEKKEEDTDGIVQNILVTMKSVDKQDDNYNFESLSVYKKTVSDGNESQIIKDSELKKQDLQILSEEKKHVNHIISQVLIQEQEDENYEKIEKEKHDLFDNFMEIKVTHEGKLDSYTNSSIMNENNKENDIEESLILVHAGKRMDNKEKRKQLYEEYDDNDTFVKIDVTKKKLDNNDDYNMKNKNYNDFFISENIVKMQRTFSLLPETRKGPEYIISQIENEDPVNDEEELENNNIVEYNNVIEEDNEEKFSVYNAQVIKKYTITRELNSSGSTDKEKEEGEEENEEENDNYYIYGVKNIYLKLRDKNKDKNNFSKVKQDENNHEEGKKEEEEEEEEQQQQEEEEEEQQNIIECHIPFKPLGERNISCNKETQIDPTESKDKEAQTTHVIMTTKCINTEKPLVPETYDEKIQVYSDEYIAFVDMATETEQNEVQIQTIPVINPIHLSLNINGILYPLTLNSQQVSRASDESMGPLEIAINIPELIKKPKNVEMLDASTYFSQLSENENNDEQEQEENEEEVEVDKDGYEIIKCFDRQLQTDPVRITTIYCKENETQTDLVHTEVISIEDFKTMSQEYSMQKAHEDATALSKSLESYNMGDGSQSIFPEQSNPELSNENDHNGNLSGEKDYDDTTTTIISFKFNSQDNDKNNGKDMNDYEQVPLPNYFYAPDSPLMICILPLQKGVFALELQMNDSTITDNDNNNTNNNATGKRVRLRFDPTNFNVVLGLGPENHVSILSIRSLCIGTSLSQEIKDKILELNPWLNERNFDSIILITFENGKMRAFKMILPVSAGKWVTSLNEAISILSREGYK